MPTEEFHRLEESPEAQKRRRNFWPIFARNARRRHRNMTSWSISCGKSSGAAVSAAALTA